MNTQNNLASDEILVDIRDYKDIYNAFVPNLYYPCQKINDYKFILSNDFRKHDATLPLMKTPPSIGGSEFAIAVESVTIELKNKMSLIEYIYNNYLPLYYFIYEKQITKINLKMIFTYDYNHYKGFTEVKFIYNPHYDFILLFALYKQFQTGVNKYFVFRKTIDKLSKLPSLKDYNNVEPINKKQFKDTFIHDDEFNQQKLVFDGNKMLCVKTPMIYYTCPITKLISTYKIKGDL